MRNLALVLGFGVCLSGCGASVPVVVSGAMVAVNATCSATEKLCEHFDPDCGASACQVRDDVCSTLAPSAEVQLSCRAH